MKNNLRYYKHEINSHNHWKFKVLRKEYGWEGEGKFWALNNEIAASENCILNLNDEGRKISLAIDLDFEPDSFNDFLSFLVEKCRLIKVEDNKITTEHTQETLLEVTKEKERKRDYIRGKREGKAEPSRPPKDDTSSLQEDENTDVASYNENVDSYKKDVDGENKQTKLNETIVIIEPKGSSETSVSVPDPSKELKTQYRAIANDEKQLKTFLQNKKPDFVEPYAKYWNFFAIETGLSKVANITDLRKKKIKTRSRESSFDLPAILDKAKSSTFIANGKWFTFDWVLESQANYIKVLEGQFDNQKSGTPSKTASLTDYLKQRQEDEKRLQSKIS